MMRSVLSCSALVLGLAASLAWGAGDAPPAQQQAKVFTSRELREKLAMPVTLEKGIAAGTSLGDALEFLSEQFGLPIVINTAAFKTALQIDDIASVQIALPKLFHVRLSAVLRILLEQVSATYLLHPDYVEVTALQLSRPETWPGNESGRGRALLPLVNSELTHVSLEEALKQLSNSADFTILLDARVGEKEGKTQVTATFKNVPLGTAVELLADMAGLGSVLQDNVLYVTSKANALALEAQQNKRRQGE